MRNLNQCFRVLAQSAAPQLCNTAFGHYIVHIRTGGGHSGTLIQLDLCHCGGIFETRKVATIAEVYYMQFAPHNPVGPISLAACLQLDAYISNLLAQKYPGLRTAAIWVRAS